MNWMYAARATLLEESEIRKALTAATAPDLISLAGGVPAAELFPVAEFRAAYDRVVDGGFLQYGSTHGYPPLRELIAARQHTTADRIIVTNGAQQGLDLVGKLLLDHGSPVIVEDPTYLGALETFRQYGAEFVGVPTDGEGIRVDAVERALRVRRARMIYTMPNFANPSGITMSLRRREELVAVARRYEVPIVEDDAYGALRYDGESLPDLSTLDSEVIRLGTFSKVLAPGLRVGWVQAPAPVVRKLVHLKERADLCGAPGAQMVVCALAAMLDSHVKTLVEAYRERRDAMVRALAALPVTWTRPEGGFFVWCTLPVDARELLRRVEGVVFVPGGEFHANRPKPNTMRLNFSGVSPERIREGVRRVGEALG